MQDISKVLLLQSFEVELTLGRGIRLPGAGGVLSGRLSCELEHLSLFRLCCRVPFSAAAVDRAVHLVELVNVLVPNTSLLPGMAGCSVGCLASCR